ETLMADTTDPLATGPQGAEPFEAVTVDLPARTDQQAPTATPSGTSDATGVADAAGEVRPFGDYELLGEIERGGMGIVYRARERHSGRLVALKMMLRETEPAPEALRRFILEARATGELHHPGIVAIHAWGEHEGHPFYTMDFVPGTPLSRLMRDGPLP